MALSQQGGSHLGLKIKLPISHLRYFNLMAQKFTNAFAHRANFKAKETNCNGMGVGLVKFFHPAYRFYWMCLYIYIYIYMFIIWQNTLECELIIALPIHFLSYWRVYLFLCFWSSVFHQISPFSVVTCFSGIILIITLKQLLITYPKWWSLHSHDLGC